MFPSFPSAPATPKSTAPLNATFPSTIENGVNNVPFESSLDTLKLSARNAIELPSPSAPNFIPATWPSAFTSNVYCASIVLLISSIIADCCVVTPAVFSSSSAINVVVDSTVAEFAEATALSIVVLIAEDSLTPVIAPSSIVYCASKASTLITFASSESLNTAI